MFQMLLYNHGLDSELLRARLHWFGYHETVGGVSAVKQEKIITQKNSFLLTQFCPPGVASAVRSCTLRTPTLAVATLAELQRPEALKLGVTSSCYTRCDSCWSLVNSKHSHRVCPQSPETEKFGRSFS